MCILACCMLGFFFRLNRRKRDQPLKPNWFVAQANRSTPFPCTVLWWRVRTQPAIWPIRSLQRQRTGFTSTSETTCRRSWKVGSEEGNSFLLGMPVRINDKWHCVSNQHSLWTRACHVAWSWWQPPVPHWRHASAWSENLNGERETGIHSFIHPLHPGPNGDNDLDILPLIFHPSVAALMMKWPRTRGEIVLFYIWSPFPFSLWYMYL